MTKSTEEAADHLDTLKTAVEGPEDLFAMDPSTLASAPCEIKNPLKGDKPTGQVVHLFPRDHPRVQSYLAERADKELRNEANLAARGKTPEPPTVEKGKQRAIELLTIATDRWENVSFGGRQNIAFSVQDAKQLYAVKFVREQCLEFLGEIENFIQG